MIGAPLPLTHQVAPRQIPVPLHPVPHTPLAPPRKSATHSNVPNAPDAVNVDVYAKSLLQSLKSAEINNPQVAGLPLLRTFACDNWYNNNNY